MGLVPDKDDVDQSFIDATDMIKESFNLGALNGSGHNLEALRTTIKSNGTWEGAERLTQAALAFRIGFGRFIQQRIRTLYNPILDAYARIAQSRGRTLAEVADDIFQLWVDESPSDTINSRDITYDTSLSKTGTGNPTVRRLTVDKRGYNLENMWVDTTTFKARATQPDVAVGEEIIEISMPSGFDIFSKDISGEAGAGGEKRNYTLQNKDNAFVKDASFESPGAAVSEGSVTTLGSWELVSGTANLSVLEGASVGYRSSVKERDAGTQYALRATADFEIRQKINRALVNGVAYDRGVWAKPNAALVADGSATIDITLGSQTAQINTNTLSAGSYQLVAAPLNENLYGENCKTNGINYVKIAGSNWPASPQCDFDAVFVREMTRFNGLPTHIIPGSTPVGADYVATLTDTLAGSEGLIALFLFLGYGFDVRLPTATGGAETVADP